MSSCLFLQHVHQIVNGDHAHQPFLVVDDRHHHQVITAHLAGGGLLIVVHVGAHHVAFHQCRQARLRRGAQRLEQAGHTHQMPAGIHHKEVGRFLALGLPTAHGLDGMVDAHGGGKGQIFGGHQPAGGLVGVEQQRHHLVGILHLFQRRAAQRLLQVSQQVGGFVGLHLVENRGQLAGVDAAGQCGGLLIPQLFEDVGRVFVFQMGQQGLLLFERQFLEHVGPVRRHQRLDQAQRTGDVVLLQPRPALAGGRYPRGLHPWDTPLRRMQLGTLPAHRPTRLRAGSQDQDAVRES
jgi:hypothetical protein